MKEATGELNSTVIVVLTIGLLSTFFFTVIWPMLRNNMKSNTNCTKAICPKCTSGDCKTVECTYTDKNGSKISVTCPYKG